MLKNVFQNYIEGWKERVQQGRRTREQLYNKTLEKVNNCIKVLSSYASIKKVILFGSLLDSDSFDEHSDIDLAYMGGISGKDYFFLLIKLEDICSREVNLVDLKTCSDDLRKVIEKEGKVLYSSGD